MKRLALILMVTMCVLAYAAVAMAENGPILSNAIRIARF